MKRRSVFFVISTAVVFLAFSMTAVADTVTIVFNQAMPGDGTYNGDYGGIYQGTVNGVATNFVCDDLQHNITNGESWTALVGQSNPVSAGVRFGPGDITNPDLAGKNLTQQEMYNMATWLALQIFAHPTNFAANAALNGAIWSIMDGGWNNSSYVSSGAQADVLAALAYKDIYNGDLIVYTPTDPSASGPQEFFSVEPVPEPGSLMLLGSGLIGLAGIVRRRLSR